MADDGVFADPFQPPRRFLKILVRIVIAAVVVAVFVATYQISRAHPDRQLVPLPTANAIGPGIGIDVTRENGTGGISCTAGFLVRTADGQPGLLVAGHCNEPNTSGEVAIHHGGFYKYPTVGRFAESVYDGNDWDEYDIGLITLGDTGKLPLVPDVDGHPLIGVADRVDTGDILCHYGVRSGEAVCGPVVVSEPNKVRFAATGRCGDSGGPVYRLRPDGTAEAVGVYIEVSNGDHSTPTCDEPHEFSIAQLIKPWLRAWDLTLVTTAAPE